MLGVVEQQRTAFAMQTPEALRIIGEKLRQMGALDVIGMLSQDPPHITYSPEMDRHVGAPARVRMGPARGANPCPPRSRFAPRRCSYNKTKPAGPVGAPAPGANGACPGR